MKIYIASSWKNRHGVEMLTSLLRQKGHTVISWIENCFKESPTDGNFEKWVETSHAQQSFEFDTNGATTCDLFIYYGPAGSDACAELGAAWQAGVPIIGLKAKGDSLGLMRKMVKTWFYSHELMLKEIEWAAATQLTIAEKQSTNG